MTKKRRVAIPREDELLRLDNQLCFALYSSSRGITRLYRPVLSKFGLTYPSIPCNACSVGERATYS